MYVYLLISKDEYELPLAVADTIKELAAIAGVKPSTVESQVSRVANGKRKKSKYLKVEIGEPWEEEKDK